MVHFYWKSRTPMDTLLSRTPFTQYAYFKLSTENQPFPNTDTKSSVHVPTKMSHPWLSTSACWSHQWWVPQHFCCLAHFEKTEEKQTWSGNQKQIITCIQICWQMTEIIDYIHKIRMLLINYFIGACSFTKYTWLAKYSKLYYIFYINAC